VYLSASDWGGRVWRGGGAPVASPGACALCDQLAYDLACFARVDAVQQWLPLGSS
jgi:hypothetical protein